MAVPYHRLAHPRSAWRPLVEVLLVAVFWVIAIGIITGVVFAIAGVKKQQELDNFSTLALTLALLATAAPLTFAAARIVKRRPGFLSSVTGRLRWRWFGRCMLLGIAVNAGWVAAYLAADFAVHGRLTAVAWPGWNTFGMSLGIVLVLAPLQCAGEEYVFRGTLMQAIGVLARSPWVAIALSSVAFVAIHGVRVEASLALAAMGAAAGWLTIRSGGLEASIALHTCNNVAAFLLMSLTSGPSGVDIGAVNTETSWDAVALQTATLALFGALVVRRLRLLPESFTTGADQIEQDPPESGTAVDHADHGGDAEPLPPE